MAKQTITSKKPMTPAAKPAPAKVTAPVASTPMRNTPLPKAAARPAVKKEITYTDIAKRAYEIWCSGQGGSETDNWLRAERELRGL
jgi:hypothetical protein